MVKKKKITKVLIAWLRRYARLSSEECLFVVT